MTSVPSDGVHAQQRAAAAAMIAEEANAARLKALLDAAREQADRNTILSAEARFNQARDDWETARDAMLAREEPKEPPAPAAGPASETPFAVEIAAAVNRVFNRLSSQQKAISLGVVAALLLGIGVGTGGYFMLNGGSDPSATSSQTATAAQPRIQTERTPFDRAPAAAAIEPSGVASTPPSPETSAAAVVPASAETAIVPEPAAPPPKAPIVQPASAPSTADSAGQSIKRPAAKSEARVTTRRRGVSRAPVAPPPPSPRVAATGVQVVETPVPASAAPALDEAE